MKAQDIMTDVVRVCRASDSLDRAARIMWEADIGCLPVLDERLHPIGMITDRDVAMAAYTQGRPLRDLSVSTAMSHHVVSCLPDTELLRLQYLMQAAQVRRVPVVSTAGSIAGIVTLADVVRAAETGTPEEQAAALGTMSAISEPRACECRHAAE